MTPDRETILAYLSPEHRAIWELPGGPEEQQKAFDALPHDQKLQVAHAVKNAIGHSLGMFACPLCGDSVHAAPMHQVVYAQGELETDNHHNKPGLKPARFFGSKSMMAACESCWQKMSMEQRVASIDCMCQKRIDGLPSVIVVPNTGGVIGEWPDDRKRWDAAAGAIRAEHQAAKQAVLAGG